MRFFGREILGRVILRELSTFPRHFVEKFAAQKTLYRQSLRLRDGLSAKYATLHYVDVYSVYACSFHSLYTRVPFTFYLSSSSNFETSNYPQSYCTKSSGHCLSLSFSHARKSFVRTILRKILEGNLNFNIIPFKRVSTIIILYAFRIKARFEYAKVSKFEQRYKKYLGCFLERTEERN